MSYCEEFGKDKIIFLSEEDAAKPPNVEFTAPAPERRPGLILENGDINWDCPCLGGMAVGPCGTEFREAFSCFHYSAEENKGAECIDKFVTMQECMKNFPEEYPNAKDDELESSDSNNDLNSEKEEIKDDTNLSTPSPPPPQEKESTTNSSSKEENKDNNTDNTDNTDNSFLKVELNEEDIKDLSSTQDLSKEDVKS